MTDKYISTWLKDQKREDIVLATKVSGNSESHSCQHSNAVHSPAAGVRPKRSSSALNPAEMPPGAPVLLQVAGYGTHNTYLRSPERTVRVTPDQIVESVDASLKRLGTDYIDLLQVRTGHRHSTPRHSAAWHGTPQRSMARDSGVETAYGCCLLLHSSLCWPLTVSCISVLRGAFVCLC